MTWGEDLRRRREALGWTQRVLCDRARVSRPAVQRIEHGEVRPTPATRRKLEAALLAAELPRTDAVDRSDGLAAQLGRALVLLGDLSAELAELTDELRRARTAAIAHAAELARAHLALGDVVAAVDGTGRILPVDERCAVLVAEYDLLERDMAELLERAA